MCQKLSQITYDNDLSSQNSSDDDNFYFLWNGHDQRNLELLFADKQESSKRLVNMLRIQQDSERLSKRRQRKIYKGDKDDGAHDKKGGDEQNI